MILLDQKTSTAISDPTNVGDAKSIVVHVYSASTSTSTVLIQQSIDGRSWTTVATVTNPSSAGEIWRGPSLTYTRAYISAYTSGTVTVAAEYTQAEVFQWAAITATATASASSSVGVLKKAWTNAELVAAGSGGTTANLLAGTIPANSRIVHAYLIVDTQATFAAGTLTASFGVTGAGYTDFMDNSSVKAAANTIYGNAAAEVQTDIGNLFYLAAQTVYIHFIAGAGDLANVTTSTGHIYIEYVTLP